MAIGQTHAANIHIFKSPLKTDQYTLIEQSADCVNYMVVCIIFTATQETSMMWLHADSYNYNIWATLQYHIKCTCYVYV